MRYTTKFEQFENEVYTTDYFCVSLQDLDKPNEKPQLLQTQCQYEELKSAIVSILKILRNNFKF